MLERLIRRVFRRSALERAEMDPASGYDLWSSTYDGQSDNLLLALDERMLGGLLEQVDLRGKRVVDVGCGTGRHWKNLLARQPTELVGYDISAGMLSQLRKKYPGATVHPGSAHRLTQTVDGSCDLLLSTLTLGHFPAVEPILREWVRVLRPGGAILLTDLHPMAAARSDCSFRHADRIVVVKVSIHPIELLKACAARNQLELRAFSEVVVDESMRPYYERADMLPAFQRMKGVPLIYGVHFDKADSGLS